MSEQTTIPVPEPPPAASKRCAWCGEPAVGEFETHPASYGKAVNGVKVLKRAATTAPVCREHQRRCEAEASHREREKERIRLLNRGIET